MPSATDVRKFGTTAVARACSREELALETKQMNHDEVTSDHYYECTRADRDALRCSKPLEKLRNCPDSAPPSDPIPTKKEE